MVRRTDVDLHSLIQRDLIVAALRQTCQQSGYVLQELVSALMIDPAGQLFDPGGCKVDRLKLPVVGRQRGLPGIELLQLLSECCDLLPAGADLPAQKIGLPGCPLSSKRLRVIPALE